MDMLVIVKDQKENRNGMELSTCKILEEYLVQTAFHQTLRTITKTQGQIYTVVAYQEDSECS